MKVYCEPKKDKQTNVYYGLDNLNLSTFVFEVEKANIYDIFKHKNEYYVINVVYEEKNLALCKKINFNKKGTEQNFQDFVICPFCGYKKIDSWELEDCANKIDCKRCGSIFSLEIERTVEYSTFPKKANKIIEVR